MPVSVGDPAPDFVLRDQHGRLQRLSELTRARNVVLMFYPWAFTGVCGGELHALQDRLADFETDDRALVCISTDSIFALRAFADREGFTFPLLSDFWPHGEVAAAYGVLDQAIGVALRGSFVIDRSGVVRWTTVNGIDEARDLQMYLAALDGL